MANLFGTLKKIKKAGNTLKSALNLSKTGKWLGSKIGGDSLKGKIIGGTAGLMASALLSKKSSSNKSSKSSSKNSDLKSLSDVASTSSSSSGSGGYSGGGYGGGYGGGGSSSPGDLISYADSLIEEARKPVDLSGLMNALNSLDSAYRTVADNSRKQALTTRDTTRSQLESQYSNARSDLLKSLERFREENAKSVENQKQSYLTGQSALESARAEADRASRISAAARGLSGSGLQQLAQLQNMLGQSQEISNLVNENQDVMDNLRRVMAQEQEDYDTNLQRATDTYNTGIKDANNAYDQTLREIDATLSGNLANTAKQRADYEYNAAMNTAEAVRQAQQNALNLRSSLLSAASGGSGGGGSRSSGSSSSSTNDYNSIMGVLNDALGDARSKATNSKNGRLSKKQYEAIVGNLESSLPYGVDARNSKEYQQTLADIYKYYKK